MQMSLFIGDNCIIVIGDFVVERVVTWEKSKGEGTYQIKKKKNITRKNNQEEEENTKLISVAHV